jgi:hypothetical protein
VAASNKLNRGAKVVQNEALLSPCGLSLLLLGPEMRAATTV